MALAYNHEEITPRELKPALYELDGISRETVEAHYKLYQGYINERQPGLFRVSLAEGRSVLRSRWDQEPRDLLRASRR